MDFLALLPLAAESESWARTMDLPIREVEVSVNRQVFQMVSRDNDNVLLTQFSLFFKYKARSIYNLKLIEDIIFLRLISKLKSIY
jgi:hypothetical protein